MALPINIEDLLNRKRIESNRVEFKRGWNPRDIYHTICAFANDFDNLGGGYILVGIEQDENGRAIRPVHGVPTEELDKIEKEMVGYNNKFTPYYMPRTYVEEIDGQNIFVIWVPAGERRPYYIRTDVTSKSNPQEAPYVRNGTSSIVAKGEVLDELRDMANRTPFDERGNENIKIEDISGILVYEHLRKVSSKLAENFTSRPLIEILDEMDLLTGPSENRKIKNVAAMMFCENPEKFFPVTRVEIVIFPEGSIENPDVMIEAPVIVGPVPKMISETLSYLRTNVIKQKIIKPSDSEKSIKFFNYPYQAFEESVVNALYHRDYQEREPVEITIEPDHVDILSYSGPDRSISAEAIKAAKRLKSRRYRNRRIGDFLKELDLSEGKATGIPTIQKHLKLNGSQPAIIDTDDNRSYFLMTIPCRAGFTDNSDNLTHNSAIDISGRLGQVLEQDDEQVNYTISQCDISNKSELVHILEQVYEQVWSRPRTKTKLVTLIQLVIDTLCLLKNNAMSAKSLRTNLGIPQENKRQLYKRLILDALTNLGVIQMTIPDKPQSSKQAYVLTSEGTRLFN